MKHLLSTVVLVMACSCGSSSNQDESDASSSSDASPSDDAGNPIEVPPLGDSESVVFWGDGVGTGPIEYIGAGYEVECDPDSNYVYNAGTISGTDISFGTFEITEATSDLVIVLASSGGPNVAAIRHFPGTGTQRAFAMDVKDGLVAVAGSNGGTMTVGQDTLIADGSGDGFLIVMTTSSALSMDGEVVFSKDIGGDGLERVMGVAIDDAGGVWVAGRYGEEFDLDGTTLPIEFQFPRAFLAHFDAAGTLLTVETYPNVYHTTDVAYGADGPYFAGRGRGTIDFGDGEVTRSAMSPYVVAYEPNGDLRWSIVGDGSGGDDGFAQVHVGQSGDIWITGDMLGSLSFETTELSAPTVPGGMFVASFAAADGSLTSAWNLDGDGGEYGTAISTDDDGGLVSLGAFFEDLEYDDQLLAESWSTQDLFVADYTAPNQTPTVRQFGGETGLTPGDIEACGDFAYVTGTAAGPTDFGGPVVTEGHDGVWFLMRLQR
jgi:hypothetical protein